MGTDIIMHTKSGYPQKSIIDSLSQGSLTSFFFPITLFYTGICLLLWLYWHVLGSKTLSYCAEEYNFFNMKQCLFHGTNSHVCAVTVCHQLNLTACVIVSRCKLLYSVLRGGHFPPLPEPIITASALWRSCYSPIIDPAQTTPRAAACHSFLIPGHALLIDSGGQVGDITQ